MELKPCPFCGCTDIRKLVTVFDCNIWCSECRGSIHRDNYITHDSLAETLHDAEAEAVEAWNRRKRDEAKKMPVL